MRTCAVSLLSALVLLTLGGCASTAGSDAGATVSAYGIGCPCCFTIVESVRSGLLPVEGHLHVQCERCCADLTFVATPERQILLARADAELLPCDLAAPAR